MSVPDGELRQVRLIRFPLDVHGRATEAFEGLRREFQLIAMRTAGAGEVPDRLLRLVDALGVRYRGFASEADRARDAAAERGDKEVDELVYRVPAEVGEACVDLSRMIDEADEFCRRGELLLTLASPAEAVAFRRWYLGEFTAQIAGEPPLPWPDADRDALAGDPRLRGTTAG
ncbi:MAG: hypothetical protein ACRD03_12755 [Acidimicrobiales bacterium]